LVSLTASIHSVSSRTGGRRTGIYQIYSGAATLFPSRIMIAGVP
jgi:hypothetical protein